VAGCWVSVGDVASVLAIKIYCVSLLFTGFCVIVGQMFSGCLQSLGLANKSLVGDPKSGAGYCVSPCVGELVFIVWSGAGRHNSTVILL